MVHKKTDNVEEFPERDIMKQLSNFQNTETIQIVAPGLLGKDHYVRLNPDLLTIVVNKAIEIDIKKDVWITCDMKQAVACEWFKQGIADHADIACILAGAFARMYPDAKWVFGFGPLQKAGIHFAEPLEGFLRYGTTVTGCALQLAYWLGAKRIILCGVDFQGDKYFDGTSRGVPVSQLTKRIAPRMNRLIAWMINKGVRIETLSKTYLRLSDPKVTISRRKNGRGVSLLDLAKDL